MPVEPGQLAAAFADLLDEDTRVTTAAEIQILMAAMRLGDGPATFVAVALALLVPAHYGDLGMTLTTRAARLDRQSGGFRRCNELSLTRRV